MRLSKYAAFFLLSLTFNGYSQSLAIYGGWHKNELFSDSFMEPHDLAYTGAEGYSFQVNYRPTASKQSLSLLLDHYKGEVKPHASFMSNDTPDVICMEKTTLGLGLYPFDIKTIGNLYIQPGADISVLLTDNTCYGYENPNSGTGTPKMTYKDDSLRINNSFQFGVCAIVRYQVNIGQYFIAPSYKIYIGGRSEFNSNVELVYDAKSVYSLRHTFSIGIGRKYSRDRNRETVSN